MVRPRFFLSAPEIAPRPECACQPRAATASPTVAPRSRRSMSIRRASLVPWRIGCGEGKLDVLNVECTNCGPEGPISRPKADRGIPQGQYVEMVVRSEGRLPEATGLSPASTLSHWLARARHSCAV